MSVLRSHFRFPRWQGQFEMNHSTVLSFLFGVPQRIPFHNKRGDWQNVTRIREQENTTGAPIIAAVQAELNLNKTSFKIPQIQQSICPPSRNTKAPIDRHLDALRRVEFQLSMLGWNFCSISLTISCPSEYCCPRFVYESR